MPVRIEHHPDVVLRLERRQLGTGFEGVGDRLVEIIDRDW